jgi:hypothetical protein
MHRYARDLPKLRWVEFTAPQFRMYLIRVVDVVAADFGPACAAPKGALQDPYRRCTILESEAQYERNRHHLSLQNSHW